MAVWTVLQFPATSMDRYDWAARATGLRPVAHRGCLLHRAHATPEGVCVTLVWDSADECDRFVDERLTPTTLVAGLGIPRRVRTLHVHHAVRDGRRLTRPEAVSPAAPAP